ncbi:MAG: tetratricopeptide repeat protein [Bacteroidia bacterium]
MYRIFYTFFILLINPAVVFSEEKADSLLRGLSSQKEDTDKVKIYNLLAWEYHSSNLESSLDYAQRALSLAKKVSFRPGQISAYNNIGIVYYFKGNYPEALGYYIRAANLLEGSGDKKKLSSTYNNIAAIYIEQQQHGDAENYFMKSLKLDEELGDKQGMAASYNNLGTIYKDQEKYRKALEFYFKALFIRKEIHDTEGMPSTLTNIGVAYINDHQVKIGEKYLTEALQLYHKNNDVMGVALAYLTIGDLYYDQKNYPKSIVYYDSSLVLSEKNNYLNYISYAYSSLAYSYEKQKNFEQAYHFHRKYMVVKDSIYNKENAGQISEMQTKYQTEKKEKELIQSRAESEKQTTLRNAFIAGFAVMLILATLILRGYRNKRRSNIIISKQKRLVEQQKELVEEKSKEILDSISYAKKIQAAILPPEDYVRSLLPDSFVYYAPKDIVSGDFYWMEPWGNKILFAAVDCTGHGVPGAFMSIVGFNLLSKAVNELGLSRPSLILNSLSKGISKTLRQTGGASEIKDGMDLALCAYDKKTNCLEYSGAFNSLYLVRNGLLQEIKADKIPIGLINEGETKSYTNHEIYPEKGDTIYIFTDGYADQFGGQKGKKFKYKQLEELLLSVQGKSMTAQKLILEEKIILWKGNLEQVDDILVIGVRF